MLARMRRNRTAILVAMSLVFTSTCVVPGDGSAVQRSGAANTANAASLGLYASGSNGQDGSKAIFPTGSPDADAEDADAYQAAEWWKADLYQYDKSLSLTKYEAVNTEPEVPLTTNEAVPAESPEETAATVMTTVAEPAITAKTTIAAEPNSVVFYSSGYGHGVGMSQNGANFYAMYDGWTYDQILSFYYPGTQLVQTGTPETEMMTVDGKTDTVVSILSQIVNNEMGPTFSDEALKAQAIAAYTYYLYNGCGAGMICKPNPSPKIVNAVKSVLGIVVYYYHAPALTMFYASSGGATANCYDIFYGDIPYMRSMPVRHDEAADPHFNSTKIFSADALKSLLERTYGVELSGTPYDWIKLQYGGGGYVSYAVIGGRVRVKGNDLREVLGLKSPKFEFVYQPGETAPEVTIVTTATPNYQDNVPHASIAVEYTTTTTTATTTVTTTTTATTGIAASEEESTSETETESETVTKKLDE